MNRDNERMSRMKQFCSTVLLCALAALLLGGCMPATLVSGGVTGVMIAKDRRTVGTQTEDTTIGYKSESVANAIVGPQGRVMANSFNKLVLLTGEVPDEGMKIRVGAEVAQITNVRRVVNELEIMPAASFGTRAGDRMTTTKVSASFLEASDVYSQALKAITVRGNVYLLGMVTEREGIRAAEIASSVSGVQRVIKVFEYISEEELERIQAQSTPDPVAPQPSIYDSEYYQ